MSASVASAGNTGSMGGRTGSGGASPSAGIGGVSGSISSGGSAVSSGGSSSNSAGSVGGSAGASGASVSGGGAAGGATAGSGGSGGSGEAIDARTLVKALGFGTNIGNTLENTTTWETGWGQPLITQSYINGLASRGISRVDGAFSTEFQQAFDSVK